MKNLDLNKSSIEPLIDRIESLLRHEASYCKTGDLYPSEVSYFTLEDVAPEIGAYPTKITKLTAGLGELSGEQRKIGALEGFRLLVSDFASVEEYQQEPIVISDGVGYLDKDTNESYVIGQEHGEGIIGLIGLVKGSRSILFWLNLLLLIVLVVLFYSRWCRYAKT